MFVVTAHVLPCAGIRTMFLMILLVNLARVFGRFYNAWLLFFRLCWKW